MNVNFTPEQGKACLEIENGELRKENGELRKENQRLNNVLNELEKIIQTDTEIYCCSESAMKSFKSAETIYRSYLLNKLKELKESDK